MPGLNVSAIQMLMILVMSSVLSGTALSIREFIKERDIYERERMAGLSATAYLFSKVLVLSVISVLQALLVVLVGLLGVKMPSSGVVIPGPALIEIFVALAVLSRGLHADRPGDLHPGDQERPDHADPRRRHHGPGGAVRRPVPADRRARRTWRMIAPARWGLGAVASTVNLNVIQSSISQGPNGQKPDALWTHDAARTG